jgi:hypothetical protein
MPEWLVGLARSYGWAAFVGGGLILLLAAYVVLNWFGERGARR